MQNTRNYYGSGSTRRTTLLYLGVFGAMLAGIVVLWWTAAMKTPHVVIPTPTLPTLNAFDFYVKASDAIVKFKEIGDASGSKPMVVLNHAQRKALVQPNLGVIKTLHQGFAYPYVNPPVRSMETLLPYYAKFRGMARLLSIQGKVRSEEGDWSGAMESDLDAMRIGADIPHGSVLIGQLVGVACQAIGRRPIWSAVDRLTAAQSRSASARLESIMDRHFSFADTMQEEKWLGQSTLLELFNDPKKTATFPAPDSGTNSEPPLGSPAVNTSIGVLFYLTHSKSRIMHDYTTWMDKSVEIARQPYGLHLPSPIKPDDSINEVLVDAFSQPRIKGLENETQNGLMLLTLALHLYQVEHGHYPTSLAKLAPACLQKLPNDPFAVKGTFLYHPKGTSYVLYSVGPDGKDDGGKVIDDPTQVTSSSKNSRYFVNQNSVGDVVAGKNIY